MTHSKQDAALKVTLTLTANADAGVSDGIDLKHSSRGVPPGDMEVLISAPALAVGELADAATLKYTIYHDANPGFDDDEKALFSDVIVQTGGGGAGAAAATRQFRLPTDCKRYIRIKTASSEAKDKSGKAATFQLVF